MSWWINPFLLRKQNLMPQHQQQHKTPGFLCLRKPALANEGNEWVCAPFFFYSSTETQQWMALDEAIQPGEADRTICIFHTPTKATHINLAMEFSIHTHAHRTHIAHTSHHKYKIIRATKSRCSSTLTSNSITNQTTNDSQRKFEYLRIPFSIYCKWNYVSRRTTQQRIVEALANHRIVLCHYAQRNKYISEARNKYILTESEDRPKFDRNEKCPRKTNNNNRKKNQKYLYIYNRYRWSHHQCERY